MGAGVTGPVLLDNSAWARLGNPRLAPPRRDEVAAAIESGQVDPITAQLASELIQGGLDPGCLGESVATATRRHDPNVAPVRHCRCSRSAA